MARIRTVKPEFWTDSLMVQLPPLARLLYVAIWTAADDHGCLRDEPERLAMEVMPREDPVEIDGLIQLLIAANRLSLRQGSDESIYLQIEKWDEHQKIDRPSKSRIIREGSRKLAISYEVRRAVAQKYGCSPGETVATHCYYCGAPGSVLWWKLIDGRPSAWVVFPGLELDHLDSECGGGETTKENIVLACRRCNRSKGKKHWIDALCLANGIEPSRLLAKTREDSRVLVDGSGKGKEGKGKEGSVCDASSRAPLITNGNRAHTPEVSEGKRGVTEAEDSLAYEQAIQAKFPNGPNPHNWGWALIHARALVDAGLSTWPELVAVTERYAAYIASGAQSVNIAAHNFFDRRKGNYWQQPWTVTNGADPPLTWRPPPDDEETARANG